jgi:NAD(P)-dependent dehydrogenase (short-subunit alcohol dehydrogenase family)
VKAAYSPADMSKPKAIAEMIALDEKTFGSVDILVNNAGIQFVSPIEEFPIEKWDAIIAINLSSSASGDPAAERRHRSDQSDSVFDIGQRVHIGRRKGTPHPMDIREVVMSRSFDICNKPRFRNLFYNKKTSRHATMNSIPTVQ